MPIHKTGSTEIGSVTTTFRLRLWSTKGILSGIPDAFASDVDRESFCFSFLDSLGRVLVKVDGKRKVEQNRGRGSINEG